jgi:hypothetical protein
MKPLRDLVGRELTWTQPERFHRRFELRSDAEVIATLQWEKAFGSLAAAVTADGGWTFKRGGFLKPHVTVREEGKASNLAVFEPGWTGSGSLEHANGRRFRWKSANFWSTQWAWSLPDGAGLLTFKRLSVLMRAEGQLEVAPAAASIPEAALLACLGWYLLILQSEDAGASVILAGG